MMGVLEEGWKSFLFVCLADISTGRFGRLQKGGYPVFCLSCYFLGEFMYSA